jgi:membrane protease YdiL (CAAX protease family)
MSTASLAPKSRVPFIVWTTWVVAALLILPVANGPAYGVIVPATALILAAVPGTVPRTERHRDNRELLVIAGLYVAVVGLMSLAFLVFTVDAVAGLFLSFAAALLVGVVGPIYYTAWTKERPLSDLGLRVDNWKPTLGLGLLFGIVQFSLTLWGYDLPAAEDWVPLLAMALVVGMFESVFFRGFIQNRLEEQFGSIAGIAGAAALYAMYHVGYGMRGQELLFLAGLGVVYAAAFALVRNILVLWPLLTPLGSFFSNVDSGDIDMPWASIMGFLDVFALMLAAIWLAARHVKKVREVNPLKQPVAPADEHARLAIRRQ